MGIHFCIYYYLFEINAKVDGVRCRKKNRSTFHTIEWFHALLYKNLSLCMRLNDIIRYNYKSERILKEIRICCVRFSREILLFNIYLIMFINFSLRFNIMSEYL